MMAENTESSLIVYDDTTFYERYIKPNSINIKKSPDMWISSFFINERDNNQQRQCACCSINAIYIDELKNKNKKLIAQIKELGGVVEFEFPSQDKPLPCSFISVKELEQYFK